MRETEEGAREQLRALGEVLSVMSRSPNELQPILDAVVRNAVRLCGATNGSIVRLIGADLRVVAAAGEFKDRQASDAFWKARPVPRDRTSLSGRVMEERRSIQIEDVRADPGHMARQAWFDDRTNLGVPLMREGVPIGVIILRRTEVAPFTPEQITLVEAFADQAAIAIENVRLFNETKEALAQQTAISDVLATISRSAFDLPAVLHTIAERAVGLASADAALIFRTDDADLVLVARHPVDDSPYVEEFLQLGGRQPTDGPTLPARAVRTLSSQYVEDVRLDPALPQSGTRTRFAVPIHRDGQALGAIVVTRVEVAPFTERQRALVETFADQAAIAMENVRLFNETKEALERQTATAEVLKSISQSVFDLPQVLGSVVESATRLSLADFGHIYRWQDDAYYLVAQHGRPPASGQFEKFRFAHPAAGTGKAFVEKRAINLPDLLETPEFRSLDMNSDVERTFAERMRATGIRSELSVPLIREGAIIGVLGLVRYEVRPFTDAQVQLVQTFADQAVIAIENVRLFNETKEALEQQTATAEILRAISRSPTDVQPVLDAIAANAVRYCGAEDAALYLLRGGRLDAWAHVGPFPDEGSAGELRQLPSERPTKLRRDRVMGRAILDRVTIHLPDLQDPSAMADFADGLSRAKQFGFRAAIVTPLRLRGEVIGAIMLRRAAPGPFRAEQIALVETFSDQAVIAIENVRLFNETKEALAQQTAVSEVLGSISASVFDLNVVLQTITDRAAELASADTATLRRLEGDGLVCIALHGQGAPSSYLGNRMPLDDATLAARAVRSLRTHHVNDVRDDPLLPQEGTRSRLAVPIVREGTALGVIVLSRVEVRPFTPDQIRVVETFAKQAAIAMENVRLFNETKEALERQTATSEVLQSISRSAFDLQSVLDTVVERAAQLCGAEQAWMRRIEGDKFRFSAYYGASSELRSMFEELRLDGALAKIDQRGMGGRAVLERRPIHVDDIAADEQLREASLAKRGGGRTCLAVPMLRDGEPIGAIVLARNRVAPFSEREIRLVETFADQAVIAVENVRLFNEIQEKSRQLEIAGRHKSEFLANMSHELRTPLNAIIGFSEVLLQGMFGTLNEKQREYQQDVLSSGRHLLSLINDILDLSKIEAGHVQLEPAEFSLAAALENGVTMVRERAARHAIGLTLELNGVDRIVADERKVKQVIFNLLTNAVKFTPDGGHVSVRAACESSEVRVAVRDTGIGIDIADRERIFLEFQQASRDPERSREGTGLGLALSKRYVELHGGRIWVESEVGRGSTFTFALPLVPIGKAG